MALEPQKFNYKAEKGGCTVARNRKPSPPPSPFHPPAGGFQGEGVLRRLAEEGKGEESPCSPDQYIGFIAEDVPDLVATNDRKGLSAMDLVAVLTKVVQEQQRTIDELTERVVELETD